MISEVGRIGSIIIFHLSKLWKATFFILCGRTFLVRQQGTFEIGLLLHVASILHYSDFYLALEGVIVVLTLFRYLSERQNPHVGNVNSFSLPPSLAGSNMTRDFIRKKTHNNNTAATICWSVIGESSSGYSTISWFSHQVSVPETNDRGQHACRLRSRGFWRPWNLEILAICKRALERSEMNGAFSPFVQGRAEDFVFFCDLFVSFLCFLISVWGFPVRQFCISVSLSIR